MRYALAFTLALSASYAYAHKAPSGMSYPPECCSNRDCAPITSMKLLPDGSREVVNGNGHTATFPPGFHIRYPSDGKTHACIHPTAGTPLCLFLPTEI